jgi:hypothetical protein
MRSVGEIVKRRLAEMPMDLKAFIASVGTNSGDMSKILAGKRKLPLHRVDLWCKQLALSGRTEQEFRTAVLLTWAPAPLRAIVEQLADERTDLRALVAHYEDVVELIAKHVEPLRKLRRRPRAPEEG